MRSPQPVVDGAARPAPSRLAPAGRSTARPVELGAAPAQRPPPQRPDPVLPSLLATHDAHRLAGSVSTLDAVLALAVQLPDDVVTPAEVGVADQARPRPRARTCRSVGASPSPIEDHPRPRLTGVVRRDRPPSAGRRSASRAPASIGQRREHVAELLSRDAHAERRVQRGDGALEPFGSRGRRRSRYARRVSQARRSPSRRTTWCSGRSARMVVNPCLASRAGSDRAESRAATRGPGRAARGRARRRPTRG